MKRYQLGDVLVDAADSATSALGTFIGSWLRMVTYAIMGLIVGILLGEPALIGGSVLAVTIVVEIMIAIMTTAVDMRGLMADIYVTVWWPLRERAGTDCPRCDGQLPLTSTADAKAHLRHCQEGDD